MSNPKNTDRPAKNAATKNSGKHENAADADSYHHLICGEVEAQLDALQEIAATLNGDIRPEITVRLRPVGTAWVGCQCGTKFVSASGETLGKAIHSFREALRAARTAGEAGESRK